MPDRVARFWSWWLTIGGDQTWIAHELGDTDRIVDLLPPAVAALEPSGRLSWQLLPGRKAPLLLVVTAEGDPTLLDVAREWLRQAPTPDARWEFGDLRPAQECESVDFEGGTFPLDRGQVAWSRGADGRLDVCMFHPEFAGWDEDSRNAAVFMILDIRLGEAAINNHIGFVESSVDPLPDARTVDELAAVVDADVTPRGPSTDR